MIVFNSFREDLLSNQPNHILERRRDIHVLTIINFKKLNNILVLLLDFNS
jgi:hypothetical protein